MPYTSPNLYALVLSMGLTSPPTLDPPDRIPSLDGLRALSIFLVVAHHTLQGFSRNHYVGLGWRALLSGSSGVYIFFEISGFLITTLLLQEYRQGSISLRNFYIRRAFRILPPLYLYIGVIIALGVVGRLALRPIDVVGSLFFFHNFSSATSMWSLQHLWTISVEEQFYLIWPFILLYALNRSGTADRTNSSVHSSSILPTSRLAAAAIPAFIILASPIARVLLARSADPLLHRIGVVYLQFDFLMFGCLVALFQQTPRFEAIYKAVSRVPWLPPALMLLCSALSVHYKNYFDLSVGFTIEGAAIALFLLWCTRNQDSTLGRFLNWKPVVHIGVLSYSIYLWQTLFLHVSSTEVFHSKLWLITFPYSWFAILFAASSSYYLVERPSLRLRRRLLLSPTTAAQECATLGGEV